MSRAPCPDREPQLESSLFGELDAASQAELDDHIERCGGCREALLDARNAFEALANISDPPFPYEAPLMDERASADKAWSTFQRRLRPKATHRTHRVYELVAMAALLVIGIGLGRIALPPQTIESNTAAVENLEITPEAIAALERAELLSDVGVRYVDGLQSLLVDVMGISVEVVSTDDLLMTRERARELLEDGRLLELALDSNEDRAFLRAIRRAELFLEELAAVESSGSGTGVGVFQTSLLGSRLPDELAALDLPAKVSLAMEASGWLGREETATRKEF